MSIQQTEILMTYIFPQLYVKVGLLVILLQIPDRFSDTFVIQRDALTYSGPPGSPVTPFKMAPGRLRQLHEDAEVTIEVFENGSGDIIRALNT